MTKEALHSLVRPDLTVSGRRRSSKDRAISECAPLTQFMQVMFMGTFRTEALSETVVEMDLMFVNKIRSVFG